MYSFKMYKWSCKTDSNNITPDWPDLVPNIQAWNSQPTDPFPFDIADFIYQTWKITFNTLRQIDVRLQIV